MCPRGRKGGPISFKHVGNEAPSKKGGHITLLPKEESLCTLERVRGGLEREDEL